jgi:hypothetical protein
MSAEGRADDFTQRLGAIDNEQPADLRVEPALDQPDLFTRARSFLTSDEGLQLARVSVRLFHRVLHQPVLYALEEWGG